MPLRIKLRYCTRWLLVILVCASFNLLNCGLSLASLPLQAPQPRRPASQAQFDGIVSLTAELRYLSDTLREKRSIVELAELRDSLPKEWTVSTPEQDYKISTDSLRGQLTAGSPENAKTWVDNLARELGSYSANWPSGEMNARAELDHILAGSEFAAVHPPSAWDLFRQRLAAWIDKLLMRLFGGLMRYPIGGQILFWIIVVACVGFIAMWVFRYMISRDRMEALPPGQIVTASRTWQEWIRAAREAASRNDFREAVHSAYWAGITRLESLGALPKDRSITPREYLRIVAQPSQDELLLPADRNFREPLTALTARLEQIWYANRGADSEDYREALRQLEAMGCQLE